MLKRLKALRLFQYDCEFIDIRIEKARTARIVFYQKELYHYNDETQIGAFIRIKKDKMWHYAATTDIENIEKELQKLLENTKVYPKTSINTPTEITMNIPTTITPQNAFHKTKEEKIAIVNSMREVVENDPLTMSSQFV